MYTINNLLSQRQEGRQEGKGPEDLDSIRGSRVCVYSDFRKVLLPGEPGPILKTVS